MGDNIGQQNNNILGTSDNNDNNEDQHIEFEQKKIELQEIAHHLLTGCEGKQAEMYLKSLALIHVFPDNFNFGSEKEFNKLIRKTMRAAHKRILGTPRSLTTEITEWIKSTDGSFMTTDVYQATTLTTREQKKKANVVLSRLKKRGIIEPAGGRAGCYRLVKSDSPKIDFLNCCSETLDIRYPLSIHEWVYTMPKNIIVIAGSPDSGKTAFLLNCAFLNMNRKMKVRYLSSEMGALELRSRLEKFDAPVSDWANVDFRERSADFQDMILPDAINIIDYLEISDSFYQIAGTLKAIYDRLQGGIAIIGIQKDFKSDIGRGGTFSLEKPRLYVTLSPNPPDGNVARIVKGKNRKFDDKNPNGRECDFKIFNGTEIFQCSTWVRPGGSNA